MMREILFRGKNVHNEWVEGYFYKAKFCRDDKELSCFITTPYPDVYNKPSDHIYIPDDSTMGQYTGLTDKNGKKIFEADVLKYTLLPRKSIVYEVIWQEEWSRFALKTVGNGINLYEWLEKGKVNYCCEIIGNIHDNPELLKGGAS